MMPIEILSDRTKYPNIPADVVQHAQELTIQKVSSRFIEALSNDPHTIAQAIDSMFAEASSITGSDPDEVLIGADFSWKDIHPYRIDGAFAEIRTINILDKHGFAKISQITGSSAPSADIVASRRGERYAIEVADSVYYARGRFSVAEISDWIIDKYQVQGKGSQLLNTASEYGCHRRVFAGVIDTAATVAMQMHPQFAQAVEAAWNQVGKDPELHIAAFTGRISAEHGSDDAIYPPWP